MRTWSIRALDERHASTSRLLNREQEADDTDFRVEYLIPGVAGTVLIAEAIRGNFDEARSMLTAEGPYSLRTMPADVMHAFSVAAIVDPPRFAKSFEDYATQDALKERDAWSRLHYANYLIRTGRVSSAVKVLNAVGAQLKHERDDPWYSAHSDAFHGACSTGLVMAVATAYARARQLVKAEETAARLVSVTPIEAVRSYVDCALHAEDSEQRDRLISLADDTASIIEDTIQHATAKAMVLHGRGDLAEAVNMLSSVLVRRIRNPQLEEIATQAAMSWGAKRRGDAVRASELAAAVTERVRQLSHDERRSDTLLRSVRYLLQAGQVQAAAALLNLRTEDEAGWYPHDAHDATKQIVDDLIVIGRLPELRALGAIIDSSDLSTIDVWIRMRESGQTSRQVVNHLADTSRSHSIEPRVAVTVIRAARAQRDDKAVRALVPILRKSLTTQLEQIEEEFRKTTYASYGRDYTSILNHISDLALGFAETNSIRKFRRAERLLRAWQFIEDEASGNWDAFRGYLPSHEEMTEESDNKIYAQLQMKTMAAEAFLRAGNESSAATLAGEANDLSREIHTAQIRSSAAVLLAISAARRESFDVIDELFHRTVAVRGGELGTVAEILVTLAVGQQSRDSAAVQTFLALFRDAHFMNASYAELISLLTVFAPESGKTIERVVYDAIETLGS